MSARRRLEIIPALDLLGGSVVRLRQGRFDAVTEYREDASELARRYRDAGATRLHLVDLQAARTGDPGEPGLVRRLVAETGLSVQVAGGIRTRDDVARWFDAGADRVVIGSRAVDDPDAVIAWIREFGSERIVAALDVRVDAGVSRVAVSGWVEERTVSFSALSERLISGGLQHLLCTDIGRDGTLAGPNLELYREILARHPGLGLIASGGIAGEPDLGRLRLAGVPACVVGRALLEGRLDLEVLACSPDA